MTFGSREPIIPAVLIAAPIAAQYDSGLDLHSFSAWFALVRSALIRSGRVYMYFRFDASVRATAVAIMTNPTMASP
jgi:hypothetical protein